MPDANDNDGVRVPAVAEDVGASAKRNEQLSAARAVREGAANLGRIEQSSGAEAYRAEGASSGFLISRDQELVETQDVVLCLRVTGYRV